MSSVKVVIGEAALPKSHVLRKTSSFNCVVFLVNPNYIYHQTNDNKVEYALNHNGFRAREKTSKESMDIGLDRQPTQLTKTTDGIPVLM